MKHVQYSNLSRIKSTCFNQPHIHTQYTECYLSDGVHCCSVIKQETNHVHLTKVTSCMKRRISSLSHSNHQ